MTGTRIHEGIGGDRIAVRVDGREQRRGCYGGLANAQRDVGCRHNRRTFKRDREGGGCRTAVSVANGIGEDILKVAAGRAAIDRRRIVRNIGIRAVRVERQMAVDARKR